MFADVIVLHWYHTDAVALATATSEGTSAQVGVDGFVGVVCRGLTLSNY